MAVTLSALHAGFPLPLGSFLVLTSVGGWVDHRATVRLEGLGQLKHPMTWLGIKPVTFQLVAQCLTQLQYCMLPCHSSMIPFKHFSSGLEVYPLCQFVKSVELPHESLVLYIWQMIWTHAFLRHTAMFLHVFFKPFLLLSKSTSQSHNKQIFI
jgi:hypothetical protein